MSNHEITNQIEALAQTDAEDHGDRITALRKIMIEADAMIAGEVAAARANGWSWGDLAPALATTRQGAQQRYGKATV